MADLAVALDLPTGREAMLLAETLGAGLTWAKVGPVLFVREGPALVRSLQGLGARVFLDLKWHDIPNTVAGAVAAAADLGVELATVHLAGGPAMLRAAAGARRSGLKLVGVGVLTSLEAGEYGMVVGRVVSDLEAEQVRLLELGRDAGLDGFVCAPPEAAALRKSWGAGSFVVTPGIRQGRDRTDDQRRTGTALDAARAGADLLVVGRPITGAADPAAALRALRAEVTASRTDGQSDSGTVGQWDSGTD